MDNIDQLLAQPTLWGLTVGQTVGIFVIAVVLFFGWLIVQIVLRLGAFLFRLGCAALIVFICGIISFLVLYNMTSTTGH